MTATEFIIDNINKMIKAFPTIRVRYAHDELADVHSIEVIPNYIYHKDKDFNNWQRDTLLDFMDRYDTESLCYLTDNSIVGIDSYDFEVFGSHFYNIPTTVVVSESNNPPINHIIFSDLFKDFNPDYITTLHTNGFKPLAQNMQGGFLEPHLFFASHIGISEISNAAAESAGENNYALAA